MRRMTSWMDRGVCSQIVRNILQVTHINKTFKAYVGGPRAILLCCVRCGFGLKDLIPWCTAPGPVELCEADGEGTGVGDDDFPGPSGGVARPSLSTSVSARRHQMSYKYRVHPRQPSVKSFSDATKSQFHTNSSLIFTNYWNLIIKLYS